MAQEPDSPRPRPSPAFPGSASRFEARGVTVRFGGLLALDDVSISAETGSVLGVIGPNGAGKTTLFNVVCGFQKPHAGSLHWDGRELRGLRPHQLAGLGISRTLQGVGLFSGLTVLENVMTGATRTARAGFVSALLGLPRSDKDEQRLSDAAMTTLSELGASQFAGRYPASLPYPVQKRVALARALVSRPRLLLLDEPASGLGNDEMDELGDLITSVGRHTAVMVVEHHMDLVMRVCDRITVLDFGRAIAHGTPEDIRSDPRVTAAYLGDSLDTGTTSSLTSPTTAGPDEHTTGAGSA